MDPFVLHSSMWSGAYLLSLPNLELLRARDEPSWFWTITQSDASSDQSKLTDTLKGQQLEWYSES